MVSFLLGLIIGLLVGAGFVFWALQRKLKETQSELRQTKRTIEDLSRAHELRVQDTVQSLQRDYRRQLESETAALTQRYEARLLETAKPSQTAASAVSDVSVAAPSAPIAQPVPQAAPLPPIADPWEQPVTVVPEPALSVAPVAPVNSAPVDSAPVEVTPSQPPAGRDPQTAIATWVKSGGAISQVLAYGNSPDATLRQQVAIALGQRYRGLPIRPGDQAVVAALSTLSRDSNPGVRQSAVEALGGLKSAAVIPMLQRSLRDTDTGVVRAASLAIAQFKHYPTPLPVKPKAKHVKR